MPSESFSIVVIARNEEKFIADCLKSLIVQSHKPNEIIAVDNNSTDKTAEFAKSIARQFPKSGIKVFSCRQKGASRARNFGWKKAKGSIVVFCDADSIFPKSWLKEISKAFKSNCAGVADKRDVYLPDNFFTRSLHKSYVMNYLHNYAPFSAWAIRKQVIKELNGFDENLECAEERDLGKRLLSKGHKICFAPKAVQFHRGSPRNFMQNLVRETKQDMHRVSFYLKYPFSFPLAKFLVFSFLWLIAVISIFYTGIFTILFVISWLSMLTLIFFNISILKNGITHSKIRNLAYLSAIRFVDNLVFPLAILAGVIHLLIKPIFSTH